MSTIEAKRLGQRVVSGVTQDLKIGGIVADGSDAVVTVSNGAVTLPSTTSIGNVSSTEIGYLDGVTSNIQTQLDAKSSGITRGTAVATTSGTYVDFTGIPSWAKRITVMFSGVSTSGTSPMMVQLGSAGLKTSGYSGAANGIFDAAPSGLNHSSGFLLAKAIAGSVLYNGDMTLNYMGAGIWEEKSIISSSTDSGIAISSGSVSMSGIVDAVRITMLNGTDTFDAGSVNIMWEG